MANTIIYSMVSSIEEARQRGQQVWDLYIKDFSSGASEGASVYPVEGAQALTSVYAISIGNRSHLDRAFILWDPQSTLAPLDSDDRVPDFMRRVTTTSPLIFQQTGNLGTSTIDVNASPPRLGAIRVAGDPANLIHNGAHGLARIDADIVSRPDTYIPVGGVQTVIDWASTNGVFINPVLHLQFWLRPPTQVPYGRIPMHQFRDSFPIVNTGPTLLMIAAMHGRRVVKVRVATTDPAVTAANIRVGAFNVLRGVDNREYTIATGAIVASAAAVITITNPNADYITVYATSTTGNGTVETEIFAIDG